uniref:Proteoglycan 3 n=1 Tax=Bos mutus grunniens TaxID=30521 RepID=A0A8B9WJM2_BOSMU
MKGCLLLLLLLLGTVSALYLEKDVPHLGDLETQADLSQDSEGSGGQEGELALSGEVLESGREEAEDTHDDEGASDPDDLDEDVQCPKEEETVQLPGSPECKSCRYRLVGTPKKFKKAQRVCRKCYRGNLASIHNFNVNLIIHRLSTTTNYGQVWIGGFIRGRLRCRRFSGLMGVTGILHSGLQDNLGLGEAVVWPCAPEGVTGDELHAKGGCPSSAPTKLEVGDPAPHPLACPLHPRPSCPKASPVHKATFSQHLLTVVSLLRTLEESSGWRILEALVLALRAGQGDFEK